MCSLRTRELGDMVAQGFTQRKNDGGGLKHGTPAGCPMRSATIVAAF